MRRVATVALAVVAVAGLLAFVPTYSNSPQKPLTALAPIAPTSCQFNGIQTVSILGAPSSGMWTLSLDGGATTTFPLAINAPANTGLDTVQLAVQGLAQVPTGDVSVTGAAGGPYTITFLGTAYNSVNLFTTANTFNNAPTGKVRATTDPQDQTQDFSALVSKAADNSTLTLPPNSCWEIDGHYPVGNLGADLFINDPNGPAVPTSNLIDGGNLTVAIASGATVTSITVSTSGHDDIPTGTAISLTNAGGGTQHFTTVGDTPPLTAPATITVTCGSPPCIATSAYPITGSLSPTNMSGFYTQLPFSPLNATDVPNGSHIFVSNGTSNMTFVTNTDTPVGGGVCGCFNVVGQAMNDRYTTAATTMIPIPLASTITLDGTSGWDIPSGSFITVATAGCGVSQCADFFQTTADAPAGDPSPIPVHAKFPAVPFDTNSTAYNTSNGLHITGHTNLTINGNGASLVQTACQPDEIWGDAPIVFPTQDTGLTIENLTITGAFGWPHANCDTVEHGPAYEKSECLIAESEVNLTINHVGCFAPQGDGMALQLPKDFGNVSRTMNTNVVVSNSTFEAEGGGYHGLSVEAVGPTAACTAQYGVGTPTTPTCGAKFINNYWQGWPTEMMDFEVDDEESAFGGSGCTSLPGGMCPLDAAQDNMLFANNTYVNWSKQWFSSGQGFGLGVQEQNLVFTNNTLTNVVNTAPFMSVHAHTPIGSAPQYWTGNWIIENNTETGGFGSTTGGGCASPPSGSASTFQGMVNLTINHNSFPVDQGECPSPVFQFTFLIDAHNFTISNNNLTGGFQVAPHGGGGAGNENYTQCGNNWGEAGSSVPPANDPAC